jgi:hypothetical protein
LGDVGEIHRDFLPRFIEVQRAFHNGDGNRITLWSTTDSVSLFDTPHADPKPLATGGDLTNTDNFPNA